MSRIREGTILGLVIAAALLLGQYPVPGGGGGGGGSFTGASALVATINTTGGTCSITGGVGTSCTASATAGIGSTPGAVITHNFSSLTMVPWVTCNDSTGNVMGGLTSSVSITDIIATSTNVATISFSTATGAAAVCRISNALSGTNGATGPTGATGATGGSTGARTLGFIFGDPAGTALTTSTVGYITVPFACTISAWNIVVDAGTATVDVWKIATGTALPTVANTITASALPAIATGKVIHSTTLTGWSTGVNVSANDILAFNINAVATTKYLFISLQCDQ